MQVGIINTSIIFVEPASPLRTTFPALDTGPSLVRPSSRLEHCVGGASLKKHMSLKIE